VLRRLRERVAVGPGQHGEAGNAIVEFLGVALLLLVPVVYLVLVLGRLQAGAFAVDGAAREAARAFVTAEDSVVGSRLAVAAVALALDDQGLDPTGAPDALTLTCQTPACLVPGSAVTATVEVAVDLPFVPGFLQGVVPLSVPIRAHATATVDAFGSGG
jgi:hypothetical protein